MDPFFVDVCPKFMKHAKTEQALNFQLYEFRFARKSYMQHVLRNLQKTLGNVSSTLTYAYFASLSSEDGFNDGSFVAFPPQSNTATQENPDRTGSADQDTSRHMFIGSNQSSWFQSLTSKLPSVRMLYLWGHISQLVAGCQKHPFQGRPSAARAF